MFHKEKIYDIHYEKLCYFKDNSMSLIFTFKVKNQKERFFIEYHMMKNHDVLVYVDSDYETIVVNEEKALEMLPLFANPFKQQLIYQGFPLQKIYRIYCFSQLSSLEPW